MLTPKKKILKRYERSSYENCLAISENFQPAFHEGVVLHWMPLLKKTQPDPRGSEREKGTSLQDASVTPLKAKKKNVFLKINGWFRCIPYKKNTSRKKIFTAGFHKPPWRFGSDHFPVFLWVICRFQSLIFQGVVPFRKHSFRFHGEKDLWT